MEINQSVHDIGPADDVLTNIAHYVLHYSIQNRETLDAARLCVIDALAVALDALDFPECSRLLGPIVPDTVVPCGSRVPGTQHVLDPVTAAFNLGCMIRWLDMNDAFTAATGVHPSDNLAAILMLGDHVSRQRVAQGDEPILMRDILHCLIKAYEIQGVLAISNAFFTEGIDHDVMVRVATAPVLTQMLGGNEDELISAVSNAWICTSLVLYRFSGTAGSRKNWASGEASSQAVHLAFMAMKGEMGYPRVLTTKGLGFYDTRFHGKEFHMPQPYAEYVLPNAMFKFVPAGMHAQAAIECAFKLHPLVTDRLTEVSHVEIRTHRETMRIMHKTGVLRNASDRDHCSEYLVALGLIHGKIGLRDFDDDFAADPRIDQLRNKIVMKEDETYTRSFDDPQKRSSPGSVQVWFSDGTSTPMVEAEYPLGHPLRRSEALSALRAKFASSLSRRFTEEQQQRILHVCNDQDRFENTPVNEFLELLIPQLPG